VQNIWSRAAASVSLQTAPPDLLSVARAHGLS
jgi:hypothetical protein